MRPTKMDRHVASRLAMTQIWKPVFALKAQFFVKRQCQCRSPPPPQAISHDGIRMPMPHPMLSLEPIHNFHVLGAAARLHQREPVGHGLAVFLFDGGK